MNKETIKKILALGLILIGIAVITKLYIKFNYSTSEMLPYTINDEGYIEFGKWYFDGGYAPIEWIKIDENENGILLISRYVIDCQDYDSPDGTWENSELRRWLNADFYKWAFSTYEQSFVFSTVVVNEGNKYQRIDGGNDTSDKVFLLSFEEIQKYFDFDDYDSTYMAGYCQGLIVEPTPYALERGVYSIEFSNYDYDNYFIDKYDSSCIGLNGARWMTRTPSRCGDKWTTCRVTPHGLLGLDDAFGINEHGEGIRPAIYIHT